MMRVHPDPVDHTRWTDYHWKTVLKKIGFRDILVEKHGLYWSVLMDMLYDISKQVVRDDGKLGKNGRKLLKVMFGTEDIRKRLTTWRRLAVRNDRYCVKHKFLSGYTTGYGVRAIK